MGNTYEAIRIDFDNVVTYTETDLNTIGAGISTTLRTIETHDDTNCIYVAKTGDDGDAGTLAEPKLTIQAAQGVCTAAKGIVTIIDSGSYDEEVTINDVHCLVVQADLGQAPTATRGVGARASSTPRALQGTPYYVMKSTGNDGNTGLSEAQAFATLAQATATAVNGDSIVVADSEIYEEELTIADGQGLVVIAKEGEVPTLRDPLGGSGIVWTNNTAGRFLAVDGFIIDGSRLSGSGDLVGIGAVGAGAGATDFAISNCTIRNSTGANGTGVLFFACDAVTLNRCLVEDCGQYGIESRNDNITVAIQDCIVRRCGGFSIYIHPASISGTHVIEDSLIYTSTTGAGGGIYAIHFDAGSSTTIRYCMFVNASGAIPLGGKAAVEVDRIPGDTTNITACGIYSAADLVLKSFAFNIATTVTYCVYDYAEAANTTAGAGCVDGDPDLCNVDNEQFGILPGGVGWHAGDATAAVDIGPRWAVFSIDVDNLTINGLNITGQNTWMKGVAHLDDQVSTTIIWSTIRNLLGVAADFFNNSAPSTWVFRNSVANACGAGIAAAGGGVVDYSLMYRNGSHGIYSNAAGESVDHCVLFGNAYGIYVDASGTITSFKNTVTAQNSSYGIFSDTTTVVATYCDIADAYNANVDVSAETNLFIAPYFRSIIADQEDFHLATVEGGFIFPEGENNPLIGAGESDIGAWNVARAEVSNVWDTYTLTDNPVRVDFQRIPINPQERFDTSGVYRRNADAFQWNITFTWPDDYGLDQDLPRIMEYLFEKNTEIRIYFGAVAGLWQGNVILDRENMRLTPSGYPTLIPDQWKSYWFELAGTTTPFKVTGNTRDYWQLADDDDELPVAGTYAAVITFIRVKNRLKTAVAPVQKYYIKDENGLEIPRNGFKIAFIEY